LPEVDFPPAACLPCEPDHAADVAGRDQRPCPCGIPQRVVCFHHGSRAVAGGDALRSPGVTRLLIAEFASRAKQPADTAALHALTDRECEVMALVAQGLSNEDIAATMFVSPATAKTHVSRAMIKVGARDRAQLVVIAYEAGLVRPGWWP
jgi:DNA-binding NarL/FixJ family response regulator